MSLESATTGLATATAPIAQVLDGTTLGVRGRAECRACRASLRDGTPVALRAHRMSDEARWTADSAICVDCVSEHATLSGTPGVEEAVVLGRLVTRSDSSRQTSQLALRAGESRSDVLDYSGVGEQPND